MEQKQVKVHFRSQVHEYEDLMRRIVPGYDIQSRLLIDLIPFDATAPMRVLDLGSGPGTLAKLVLERYSNAEVVAFDLTEEMLDAARDRCGEFGSRLATVVGNYAVDDVGSSYDLVLAGLTLQQSTTPVLLVRLAGDTGSGVAAAACWRPGWGGRVRW